MDLLIQYLHTRQCHGKQPSHTDHSVTVICDFQSLSKLPSPDAVSLIPIPILGYVQFQSNTVHTTTNGSWKLHGSHSLAALCTGANTILTLKSQVRIPWSILELLSQPQSLTHQLLLQNGRGAEAT